MPSNTSAAIGMAVSFTFGVGEALFKSKPLLYLLQGNAFHALRLLVLLAIAVVGSVALNSRQRL